MNQERKEGPAAKYGAKQRAVKEEVRNWKWAEEVGGQKKRAKEREYTELLETW